eukprot:4079871-Heterocapsa_arctica.AAC.1
MECEVVHEQPPQPPPAADDILAPGGAGNVQSPHREVGQDAIREEQGPSADNTIDEVTAPSSSA